MLKIPTFGQKQVKNADFGQKKGKFNICSRGRKRFECRLIIKGENIRGEQNESV
jgi:hypothetical protein